MRSVDLVSREWCDLVFEGRNRLYGAYRLRQEAGRRYRRALLGTAVGIALAIFGVCGLSAYLTVQSDRDLQLLLQELQRMEAMQRQDAHLLRFVDMRPKADMAQEVVATVPEIVEEPLLLPPSAPVQQEETIAAVATEDSILVPVDTLVTATLDEATLLPPLTPTEVVREMPEFPGGATALMRWLDANIVYPPLLVGQDISGTTYLTFLVDKDGGVTEARVEEPLHPMISAAIMTAARKMPKWEPGRKDGQLSIVRVTIPIEYHN